MNIKKLAKSTASALGTAATFALDSPSLARIHEIDEEIKQLQEEKQRLQARLINKTT